MCLRFGAKVQKLVEPRRRGSTWWCNSGVGARVVLTDLGLAQVDALGGQLVGVVLGEVGLVRLDEHFVEVAVVVQEGLELGGCRRVGLDPDRKSTRLNSSH